MTQPLSYCPDSPAVLARLRRLYADRAQDVIIASMDVPSKTLTDSAHAPASHEGCEYPDPHERSQFWDTYLQERIPLHDDSIPMAQLKEFDQGLYGGLVGGNVRIVFRPDIACYSSMVPPVLNDLSEIETLSFSKDNVWFQRYLNQMDVFSEAARGKYGVSHLILIDGLNFMFELVGATNTYMEMIDRPELVRKVIDLAFDLNVAVQEAFFDHVPLLEGGTCSSVGQWFPGRVISESVDPFHLASVETFEEWGREHVAKVFARFDGGVVHIHGNGRHLLEAVSSLRGLLAIQLMDDGDFPPAFDVLAELRARTGDVPLILNVPFERFKSALGEHALLGGVFYKVDDVPDIDAANRCMDQVRQYRI